MQTHHHSESQEEHHVHFFMKPDGESGMFLINYEQSGLVSSSNIDPTLKVVPRMAEPKGVVGGKGGGKMRLPKYHVYLGIFIKD